MIYNSFYVSDYEGEIIMFDIVVCSMNIGLLNRSIKIINKALIDYEFDYRIFKFKDNDSDLFKIINSYRRKLYIIDIDNIDIAFKIRENDFRSIIIVISSHDSTDNRLLNERLMFLDYLCNSKMFDYRLKQDIYLSMKILFKDNIFVFMYNHVLYRIPYEDINYIEKEPQIKRCIIHTMDKDYYIVNSIEKINNNLSGMFIKTSQSCIINLMNVRNVDYVNNLVCFKNGDMTTLLTNKMKKIIKEYM